MNHAILKINNYGKGRKVSANNNNISKNDNFFCVKCNKRVIFCEGKSNIPHFKHRIRSSCDYENSLPYPGAHYRKIKEKLFKDKIFSSLEKANQCIVTYLKKDLKSYDSDFFLILNKSRNHYHNHKIIFNALLDLKQRPKYLDEQTKLLEKEGFKVFWLVANNDKDNAQNCIDQFLSSEQWKSLKGKIYFWVYDCYVIPIDHNKRLHIINDFFSAVLPAYNNGFQ